MRTIWHVAFYYKDGVRKRRWDDRLHRRVGPWVDVSGQLVIQTWHTTESSRDTEVAAGHSRDDVDPERTQTWETVER